jgi:hypothetical protein
MAIYLEKPLNKFHSSWDMSKSDRFQGYDYTLPEVDTSNELHCQRCHAPVRDCACLGSVLEIHPDGFMAIPLARAE